MTTAQALPPLVPMPQPHRLPLSSAQARMWFLHRLDGPNPTYNVPLVWTVTGSLDTAALAGALADVRARHESLRTVFGEDDGRPFQCVVKPDGLAPCLTVEQVAQDDLAAAVDDVCRVCFDLTSDVPFRAWLIRSATATSTAVLVLLAHHIAVDGWSLGPLLRDLSEAYAARQTGIRPAWPQLPVQYSDFSLWQDGLLAGRHGTMHPTLRAELEFWTAALADMPVDAAIPADHPGATDQERPAATVDFTVGPEVRRGLLTLARECRTSLFVALHAAVAVLLCDAGAGTDVPIGVPVAGRDTDQLDDLVGMFVNVVILRADVSRESSFRQLVTQLARRDLDALAHGRIPFDQVMDALNQRRDLGRSAGFRIMMGLEQELPAKLILAGAQCVVEPVVNVTAKCDLDVTFVAAPGKPGSVGLSGYIQYDRSMFEAATIETLTERLLRLLEDAAVRPDVPLHQFLRTAADTPRTETVELLTELVAECLARPGATIGIHDDLFELGLDQFAVARLVNHIRNAMDVEFGVEDLRRMPTVAAIATWLDHMDEAAPTS